MKRYLDLEKVTVDPHVSLGIADGFPIALDEEERQELHSLDELLALSVPAGELHELAATSYALGCTAVRVLRVDGLKVGWGPIEPGFFGCLQEDGHYLCLIADPDPGGERPTPSIQAQFVNCIAHMFVNQAPRLGQLIGYLVAAREAGLDDERPHVFADLPDDHWKVGAISSFREAFEFAKVAADSCTTYQGVSGFATHVVRWLESDEIAGMTFGQLMASIRDKDPFAEWRHRMA